MDAGPQETAAGSVLTRARVNPDRLSLGVSKEEGEESVCTMSDLSVCIMNTR